MPFPRPSYIYTNTYFQLAVVMVLFAGVGFIIVQSRAATNVVVAEAESGIVTAPAAGVTDAGASGGQAVRFASPASATPVSCSRSVSTAGNDAADGSLVTPWKSIQLSLDKLRAGDTLCIRGGTYAEEVRDASLPKGTATARITLTTYPGERVIIDGAASFSDPDFWTISGIEWINPTPLSIELGDRRIVTIVGGTGWEFSSNNIHTGDYAGLLVGKSTTYGAPHNYVIRGNIIHDTQAVNHYHNPGKDSTGGLIERNLYFNAGTENLKLGWGGTGVCTGTNYETFGIGEVTARYNTLHKSIHYGLIIAESGGIGRVDAYRNLISGAPKANVRYDNTEGCLGDKVYVQNNAGAASPKFSEDFGVSPVNKSHETGNIYPVDPKYDSLTVGGFKPTNPATTGYGHLAP